jgi:hypothetical protein
MRYHSQVEQFARSVSPTKTAKRMQSGKCRNTLALIKPLDGHILGILHGDKPYGWERRLKAHPGKPKEKFFVP